MHTFDFTAMQTDARNPVETNKTFELGSPQREQIAQSRYQQLAAVGYYIYVCDAFSLCFCCCSSNNNNTTAATFPSILPQPALSQKPRVTYFTAPRAEKERDMQIRVE
jgi:hypothetical protein